MPKNRINDVFLSCRAQLTRIVSKMVPPNDIEDIVQETYVRACQFSSRTELKSPRALMIRIARNIAIDKLKRAENRLTVQLQQVSDIECLNVQEDQNDPYSQSASSEEFSLFCEAVRYLPIQCRKVFILKKVYGYSQKEVAKKLCITENMVEKLVAQGIRKCARYMRAQQDGNCVNRVVDSHLNKAGKAR